jgi:hypothetical protein
LPVDILDSLSPIGAIKDQDMVYSGVLFDYIRPFGFNQPGQATVWEMIFDGRNEAHPARNIAQSAHKND